MGLKSVSPTRISFWIILLMLTGLITVAPRSSHEQPATTASVNSIQNGNFEGGIDSTGLPVHWANSTHDCQCPPGPTITVNNTESISGYAARLDIGQTSIGFMGMWQSYPQNTFFSDFTQRPDQLDFWFRLDPKYAGLGDFQIKFLAQNAQELDYVIDPQTDILSYPNQTFPSGSPGGQPSVKYILLGRLGNDLSTPLMAPPGTWAHFTRDVPADWTARMSFTGNNTCNQASPCMLPGFPLDDIFSRIEFDNIGFKDSAGYRGMTAWIDDVKLYENMPLDFELSTGSSSLIIPPGTSSSPVVSVSSKNNFTGTVGLSAHSPIQNITASFGQSSVFLQPSGSVFVTLTISVANLTRVGLYNITVAGASGTVAHALTVAINVPLPNEFIHRNGWSLVWQISNDDGIILKNVSLNGTSLISDARLPGVYSTYTNNLCGPFYEEPQPNSITPSQVFVENVSSGGFQIRAPYFVGGEFFHQVWRFLPDGTFQGYLVIGPGGCLSPHFYEVRWRYDFNLAPADALLSFDGSAWRKVSQEAQIQDLGYRDVAHFSSPWAVTGGGRSYFFSPMDNPSASEPGKVLAVVERPNEIETGHSFVDPTNQNNPAQWVNGESLAGQDTSFWYVSKHLSPGPVNNTFQIATGLGFHLQSPSNLPPIASFTVSTANPNVGQAVMFDASSSYDPNGNITNYQWRFGDGTQTTGSIVNHTFSIPGNYTVFLMVLDNSGNIATGSEAFQVRSDLPPVASFTFSPLNPRSGDDVRFNGFPSFDLDGSIQAWSWNFGDGTTGSGPTSSHIYSTGGNFTVTLTVTDNAGLSGTTSLVVSVISRPLHDVGITFVSLDQSQVFAGQVINVHVGVVDNGLSTETVDVTVYYGSHVAAVLSGVVLPAVNSSCNFCGVSEVNVVWDTTGVPAGNYTLSATMLLASDPTPADNTFADGNVEILPPPTITVTPNSGSLGDQVTIRGSNFPRFQYGPAEFEITFDNQLLGFTFPRNGSFTFTFNVPHADPTTPHHIHAIQLYPFSLDVQASFTVLPEPTQTAPLKVEVDSGILYFPGDTATIYISTSQNGQQVSVTSLQIIIVKPSGSNVSLTTVQVSTGLWKATYTVPTRGSTGTYAVAVHAHRGSVDGSGLGSFEVKQSWISANGRAVGASILGAIGVFGVLAVAWKRGVFKKKDELPFA